MDTKAAQDLIVKSVQNVVKERVGLKAYPATMRKLSKDLGDALEKVHVQLLVDRMRSSITDHISFVEDKFVSVLHAGIVDTVKTTTTMKLSLGESVSESEKKAVIWELNKIFKECTPSWNYAGVNPKSKFQLAELTLTISI